MNFTNAKVQPCSDVISVLTISYAFSVVLYKMIEMEQNQNISFTVLSFHLFET